MEQNAVGLMREAVANAWQTSMHYLPNLLGAIGLLLVGWLASRLAQIWVGRLVGGLDRFARKTAFKREIEESHVDRFAAQFMGRLAFWLVFLFFIAAALEALGLHVATTALTRLSGYLPNVVASVVILVAGLLAGRLARSAILRAATSAGIARAESLAGVARGTVLVAAAVVATDQLGIDSTLFIVAAGVTLGSVIGAIGLAFGLGARTAVSNIIAAHQTTQLYRAGERVRIGDTSGVIVEVRAMGVLFDTSAGRVFVPAREFLERASTRLAQAD